MRLANATFSIGASGMSRDWKLQAPNITVLLMFADRTRWNLQANQFSLALEARRKLGREILDLTTSNPTTAGLHYDEGAILSGLSNRDSLIYEPDPKGLRSAREAVVGYYKEAGHAPELDPESVILTASTSEAYSYLFRLLCNPGDEVLVGTPGYPLFEYLAETQDVRLISYELVYDHGWQLDFHSLRQKLSSRTRAIMLINPNNPTGSYVSEHERTELNAIATENDLALVVDEVFLDFALDGASHTNFAGNTEALTFTLSGLSKVCALPQMKLAWLIASGPEKLKFQALSRLEVIADTYLSPSTPIQHAVAAFLETRPGIRKELMARIPGNLAELDRQLVGQQLCQRLEVQGGWYAVLRVPVTRSDEQLAVELLVQQSVVVHPGMFFDFHSEGYLVLSLITPPEVFAEGIRRVLAYVH
jgi:alanine-synthesizing transaminase